jgi:hypothetical protein
LKCIQLLTKLRLFAALFVKRLTLSPQPSAPVWQRKFAWGKKNSTEESYTYLEPMLWFCYSSHIVKSQITLFGQLLVHVHLNQLGARELARKRACLPFNKAAGKFETATHHDFHGQIMSLIHFHRTF